MLTRVFKTGQGTCTPNHRTNGELPKRIDALGIQGGMLSVCNLMLQAGNTQKGRIPPCRRLPDAAPAVGARHHTGYASRRINRQGTVGRQNAWPIDARMIKNHIRSHPCHSCSNFGRRLPVAPGVYNQERPLTLTKYAG